jgi:DNA-binding beta-propeller fold protein YncE
MAAFQSRVYFLDSKNNQIFRFSRGSGGYGSESAWLSDEGVNLAGAEALSIDGNIYVLERNGNLTKLFQGDKVDFALSAIDPPMEHASSLWTSEDTNFIYIIDPAGNRLIQFTKSGSLREQYIATQFSGAQGLTVDEAQNKVYLKNGKIIYSIELSK